MLHQPSVVCRVFRPLRCVVAAVESHLAAHPFGYVAALKIDTEGFEIPVLQSLRPVWHLIDNVIMELQPRTWPTHNVSTAVALATVSELVSENQLTIVTLPHASWKELRPKSQAATADMVDPCKLPTRLGAATDATVPRSKGLRNAEVFRLEHLTAALENAFRGKGDALFFELLLTHWFPYRGT